MAGERPQDPEGEDPAAREPERVGPLTLARHRKDDGRALLLFGWAGEDQERGADRERGAT